MRKKKLSRIPKFKTLEEEANFWETHSFVDFEDELEEVNVVVELQKTQGRNFSLAGSEKY